MRNLQVIFEGRPVHLQEFGINYLRNGVGGYLCLTFLRIHGVRHKSFSEVLLVIPDKRCQS